MEVLSPEMQRALELHRNKIRNFMSTSKEGDTLELDIDGHSFILKNSLGKAKVISNSPLDKALRPIIHKILQERLAPLKKRIEMLKARIQEIERQRGLK